MILKIKESLDTIKPDENLISDTELMLRARILKKHTQFYQKLAIAACLVFIVGAMSLTGYYYYQYPANYLDIDINPSLELDVNRFDRVVNVKYFNEDAKNLIEESELCGCKSEEAVSLVLEAANLSGYISQDETTVVSLAVCSNGTKSDNNNTATLLGACTSTIEQQYNNVAIYSATISSDTKKEADSVYISAGKMNLIKMIQSLDQTATVDSYKDASVSNIFNKLTYLTADTNTGVSEETKLNVRNGIKKVTEQIERINKKHAYEMHPSPDTQNHDHSATVSPPQSRTDSQSQADAQIAPESNHVFNEQNNNHSGASKPSPKISNKPSKEATPSEPPSMRPKSSPAEQEKTGTFRGASPSDKPTADVNTKTN